MITQIVLHTFVKIGYKITLSRPNPRKCKPNVYKPIIAFPCKDQHFVQK